jgi:3-methyladenine DNA glycosylase AlkC
MKLISPQGAERLAMDDMFNPVKELEEGMERRKEIYMRKHQELMSLYEKYNQTLVEKNFDELKGIKAETNQAYVDLDRLKHEWMEWVNEWRAWNLPRGEEG